VTVDLSGASWFKSSFSESNGQCVEVAHLDDGTVGTRDSKNPTGPALAFTPPHGTSSSPEPKTANSTTAEHSSSPARTPRAGIVLSQRARLRGVRGSVTTRRL
jgi:hypothetical protein